MAFTDFHARFYAASGDDRLIDRVSTNDSGATTATYGSDVDGEYMRVEAQLAVALGTPFDPDSTGGYTIAVLFKKRTTSSFFHWLSTGTTSGQFGNDGHALKHQSASETRVGVYASAGTAYYNLGATSDGDLIGYVLNIQHGVINPTARLWVKGASHSGTDPDQTIATAFSATTIGTLSHINFDQSGSADLDLYALALWDEVLSDADCSTLVETLYSSIVTGTLGGGDLPPVFDGPDISVPTLQESVAMSSIDVSGRFSDPELGTLTYDKAGTWPSGVTVTSAGVIQGTPAASSAGTYTGLTVTANDGTTTTASNSFSITVNPPQGTVTTDPLKNNAGTVLASETGITVYVYLAADGTLVATITGETTDASGVLTFTHASMVQGTSYRFVVVLTSGAEGMGTATAA